MIKNFRQIYILVNKYRKILVIILLFQITNNTTCNFIKIEKKQEWGDDFQRINLNRTEFLSIN